MKKLGRKKPQKVIHRPLNQCLAMFYDLSNSRRFEIAIFILIFLNMVSMAIEHYDQPHAIFFVLEVSNAFFTTVFGLGKWQTKKNIPSFFVCVFRGVCENYWPAASLFHGPLEHVWFFTSPRVNPRYSDGGHNDWFSCFADITTCCSSLPYWPNSAADQSKVQLRRWI